jgi:hypothetical protein
MTKKGEELLGETFRSLGWRWAWQIEDTLACWSLLINQYIPHMGDLSPRKQRVYGGFFPQILRLYGGFLPQILRLYGGFLP